MGTMMKLTPLDIQQQQFKGKMFGGLDPEDVDQFLQVVAQAMEELLKELAELKSATVVVQTPCYHEAPPEPADDDTSEANLRSTLLAAHKVIETMQDNARKESELLLAEAKQQAQQVIDAAQHRVATLHSEISALVQQRLQFELELKAILETHSTLLGARS